MGRGPWGGGGGGEAPICHKPGGVGGGGCSHPAGAGEKAGLTAQGDKPHAEGGTQPWGGLPPGPGVWDSVAFPTEGCHLQGADMNTLGTLRVDHPGGPRHLAVPARGRHREIKAQRDDQVTRDTEPGGTDALRDGARATCRAVRARQGADSAGQLRETRVLPTLSLGFSETLLRTGDLRTGRVRFARSETTRAWAAGASRHGPEWARLADPGHKGLRGTGQGRARGREWGGRGRWSVGRCERASYGAPGRSRAGRVTEGRSGTPSASQPGTPHGAGPCRSSRRDCPRHPAASTEPGRAIPGRGCSSQKTPALRAPDPPAERTATYAQPGLGSADLESALHIK